MDERTPPGERDVFNMLAAGPDDWVALHSLDLAPWNRGLRTEIDFLLIVPDTGLLCIEVKSYATISFENDKWNPPDIKRSPFKQASDGRHTFYRRLREVAPQFRRVPAVHCCVFPNARFDLSPNLSVQPWELVDGRTFRGFARGDEFCSDLRAKMRRSIQVDDNLQPLAQPLSAAQIETIVSFCFPVQKRRPGLREEIQRHEREIEHLLRDQQKPVLQLTALNNRVVIDGPAGTGKTLIAMEVARRAAADRRVGLVCFNQLIGDWMRRQMEHSTPILPNLVVGRAIRIMAEMTAISIPKNPPTEYWDHDLPEQLEERLTDPDFRAVSSFDYLVVDEAQDLLARPRLWECLARFLEGGAAAGSFCLFGDFDNQVFGGQSAMEQSLASIQASAKPANYRLSENCRNYKIIGDSAVRLSGFNKLVYSGYMRSGGGIQNYDISFYEHEPEQLDKLSQWLREFRARGYKSSEITVLSFRNSDDCAAARLAGVGFNLRPAWKSGDSTGYTSVHAFKGMENKVVIITDVILGAADFHRHLFYAGMTRASEFVRVLCDRNSQNTLMSWLTGKAV
ncbi:MAG TPA: NERD domain-containing protein [Verrucomicrobiae bacterium]|nr:NERD domain-containing protein [Verrucomicrobiae bacterium]